MSIVIPNPPEISPAGLGGSELAVQRRLTAAFIARLPVTITLTPRGREKTPSGGSRWVEGTPRDPQVMTLIEMSTVGGMPTPTRTVDGVERVVEFELLGEWDAVMAPFDVFTYQDKDWEIIGVFYENGYERRALVSARG